MFGEGRPVGGWEDQEDRGRKLLRLKEEVQQLQRTKTRPTHCVGG